jgi:molybdate/tungstate transport system permease protein
MAEALSVGGLTARARPATRIAEAPSDYLIRAGMWLLGGLLVAFIVLPIVHVYVPLHPGQIAAVALNEGVLQSIQLSVEAAALAAVIAALSGTPLAYRLSRDRFAGKGLLEAVVDLPLAVPHSVAGIALLFVFGRDGILGRPLATAGLQFWGSFAGIVVGMLFVSCPFMVNAARLAFDGVDRDLEDMAATMGASAAQILWHVAIPQALRGIFTGAMLTYARSLAEFGAIVVLAYYPMTAPVKIYDLFLQGGLGSSTAGAVLLLTVALGTFLALRALSHAGSRA